MDWESGVFFVSGGDIGWQDRQIGEEGLKNLVLDMPERMWVLACLHACRLPEVAERVVEAWQEFDERVRKLHGNGESRRGALAWISHMCLRTLVSIDRSYGGTLRPILRPNQSSCE